MSSFVASKVPILDAPGKLKNELYYDVDSTTIQEVEVTGVTGRFSQSLSSLNFGSVSQITIPSANFLSATFLHLELPPLLSNQSLSSGWAYSLVRNLSFNWSGANISSLQITGETLRQIAMLESSRSKAEARITRLGGEAIINGPSTKPITSTILLNFPWSNFDYTENGKKKPYDTSLLNGPITISIELYPATRIYGNSSPVPASLKRAEVFTREYVLENRGNSIRSQLMANPDLVYNYPWIHKQSSTVFNLKSLQSNTVDLGQFLNSDLLGISFAVKRKIDQQSGLISAGSPPNSNLSMQCTDIELSYNGQSVYKCPGRSAQLINMLFSDSELGVISDTLISTGFTADQIQSYVYLIPFGSDKNVSFRQMYDNTARYPSETMQLTLTPQNYIPADVTEHDCILEVTYYYSAAGSVKNGVMHLQFS